MLKVFTTNLRQERRMHNSQPTARLTMRFRCGLCSWVHSGATHCRDCRNRDAERFARKVTRRGALDETHGREICGARYDHRSVELLKRKRDVECQAQPSSAPATAEMLPSISRSQMVVARTRHLYRRS